MKDKKMKLYVWEGVLTDWTDGVGWINMFALAESSDEAREVIKKKAVDVFGFDCEDIAQELKGEPREVSQSEGFFMFGGG